MEFEKKSQNHGKIMEFQNISLEESWEILFCITHGKMMQESWEIMEKSWNLIPGKCWEP